MRDESFSIKFYHEISEISYEMLLHRNNPMCQIIIFHSLFNSLKSSIHVPMFMPTWSLIVNKQLVSHQYCLLSRSFNLSNSPQSLKKF